VTPHEESQLRSGFDAGVSVETSIPPIAKLPAHNCQM
jgi:hypothetical protein